MELKIGSKIRALRKEKNINQEKLADYMGVCFQTVSKWETDTAYPDITHIPKLAAFFGVTTDELLGVDKVKDEQKIQEYLDEYHRLGALGETFKKFDLMCKAYEEFPYDFRIMEEYAWQLNYDPHCTGPYGNEVHKEELYKICTQILDDCSIDKARYSALSILGGLYLVDGKVDKAVETAKRFPEHYIYTADEECENIYERGSDDWWPWVQKNIQSLTGQLTVKIRNTALHGKFPPDEKIYVLKKAISILEIIYDKGDYNFYNYNLAELNILIANRYIEKEEYDIAFEYLEKGLNFAKAYDDLPMKVSHTSVLVNRLTQDMMNICSGSACNDVARELESLNRKFYDPVRDMKRFNEIIEKFTMFAKKEKQHKEVETQG